MKNAHIILEAVSNHDHLVWWEFPSGADMKQWSWIWLIGAEFSAQCRHKHHLHKFHISKINTLKMMALLQMLDVISTSP
jgi:hypothetical protein